MQAQKQVMIFADMLGFAALTEKHEDIELEHYLGMRHEPSDEFLTSVRNDSEINLLASQFMRFHFVLEQTIRTYLTKCEITSISFSDSAFVATEYMYHACDFATDLLRDLIKKQIPARIGIGYGSFLMVRFRADTSLTGGDHAAQFLGTAVVRAHAAERCGVKGLRILLHPSATALLDHEEHSLALGSQRPANKPILCAREEQANAVGVTMELNYLWQEFHDQYLWSDVDAMRRGPRRRASATRWSIVSGARMACSVAS